MYTIEEKIGERFSLVQDENDKHKFYIVDEGYVVGVRIVTGEDL